MGRDRSRPNQKQPFVGRGDDSEHEKRDGGTGENHKGVTGTNCVSEGVTREHKNTKIRHALQLALIF